MIFASLPYRILHEFQIPLYDQMRERDKDFYDRLEAAGFQLDWGEDGSGLFMKYLRRGSGYYIDVGASELVADGEIKLKAGQGRAAHRARGRDGGRHRAAGRPRRLRDGLQLDERPRRRPDLPGGRRQGRQGLGPRLGHQEGPRARGRASSATCGSRPSRRALWFHGGNLHQSRHYSIFLALQLKARMEGHRHPRLRPAGGAPPQLSVSGASSGGLRLRRRALLREHRAQQRDRGARRAALELAHRAPG